MPTLTPAPTHPMASLDRSKNPPSQYETLSKPVVMNGPTSHAVPGVNRVAQNQLDMFEHRLSTLKTGQLLSSKPIHEITNPDISNDANISISRVLEKVSTTTSTEFKSSTVDAGHKPNVSVHRGWSTVSREHCFKIQNCEDDPMENQSENIIKTSLSPSPSLTSRHPILGGLSMQTEDSRSLSRGKMTSTLVHASLPRQGSESSSNHLLWNSTANLTRGLQTIVDKLMVAPFQAAAFSTAMAASHMANMAIPEDPGTAEDRKILLTIQNVYTRIGDAVRNYQTAVHSMIESEAILADIMLQEAEHISMNCTSPLNGHYSIERNVSQADNALNDDNISVGCIDPRIAPILEDYGKLMKSHALQSIGYGRALDALDNQLSSFITHALADCLETQRQTSAVYTELELYRATGIAHLVAANHHLSQGLQRAAVAPFKLITRSKTGNTHLSPPPSNTPQMLSNEDLDQSNSPSADKCNLPMDANIQLEELTLQNSIGLDRSACGNSDKQDPIITQRNRSKSDSCSKSPKNGLSTGTIFGNDSHASTLRNKHDRLMDVLKAKTRVLQDKVVTDLSAQLTALTMVNHEITRSTE